MKPLTGDIVCIGPTDGKSTRFQWLIQRTGSWSTHNAPIYVDRHGKEFVLHIASPYARLIPLDDYREMCRNGRRRMVIIRYCKWPCRAHEDPVYDTWRKNAASVIRAMNILHLLYDWEGIISQARTWLRDKLGLPRIFKHKEWKIWCSEGCGIVYEATRLYVPMLRKQTMLAPIHFEKALAAGEFYVIENLGVEDDLLPDEAVGSQVYK